MSLTFRVAMLIGSKRNNILHHAVRHFTWRRVAEKAQAALCAVCLFFLAVRPQRPVKLHRIHVLTSNRMNSQKHLQGLADGFCVMREFDSLSLQKNMVSLFSAQPKN